MKNKFEIICIGELLIVGFLAGIIYERITEKNRHIDFEIVDIYPHQEQFIDDFTEIHKVVKKKYTHWKSKKLNADSLFLVYSGYINAAKTNDEYKNLLLAYFAELKNMHANVYLEPAYKINCEAKLVENRVFVSKRAYSLATESINIKDEILAVEGIPVLEWLNPATKIC